MYVFIIVVFSSILMQSNMISISEGRKKEEKEKEAQKRKCRKRVKMPFEKDWYQ